MEIRQAYLIERAITDAELDGFLSVLRQGQSHVYLTEPHTLLQQEGAILWEGLSRDEVKEANDYLLTSLNELGHKAVRKDTVAGRLAYRGFHTWYYHKFRINFKLQPLIQQFWQYKKLGARYPLVYVYTAKRPDPLLKAELPSVEFIYLKGAPAAPVKKSAPFREQLSGMWERFQEGFQQHKKLPDSLPKHVFVINHSHYKPLLDPDQIPELYIDNPFVGYFLKKYGDRFLIIDKLLFEKGPQADHKEFKQSSENQNRLLLNNEWIEWPVLLNPLVLFRIWRFNRFLKKRYPLISRGVKVPFSRLLLQEVERLHRSTLYFYFTYLAYRRFFRKHKFQSLSLLDEYSPNFRALVEAAKKEGVRTQAIQHGTLSNTNPGYAYTESDLRFDPWPERTLVWGEYWRDVLQRTSAYPAERLKVVGQIRTDIIPALNRVALQAHDVLGPHTKGKFLILFASQPQPNQHLRRQAALDVFTAAKQLPEAWVLVKPHPRETDAQYFTALAEEAGCSNYTILPDFELFLLLRFSHVLVHCYSTVGVEAVYFGLPAIILDYLKQDLMQFAREGVALQASTLAELEQHLAAMIKGEVRLDPKKQQAYIQKYACAIDGKVSDRTAQALFSTDVE